MSQWPGATLVRPGCSRYSTTMRVAFELPPAQAERLRIEAARLGLSPEDLARAALTDLLATPDAEFETVAARVLAKNRELYKRLA
jgi:plasmid stability protein